MSGRRRLGFSLSAERGHDTCSTRTYRFLGIAAALLLAVTPVPSAAQSLTGPAADPQFKFSTAMPSGVASPDRVETRLGTLNFFDGFPDKASAATLLDNLDFQRAVQAYLLALPAVNQAGNREAILTQGPANGTVPIWEQLVDSRTIELTANDNTPYTWFWIDLHAGPSSSRCRPRCSAS